MSLNNDPDGLGPDSPASDIYAPTGSRWGDGSHSKDNGSCCGRLSRYVKRKYADARGRLALMNSTFGGKFVIYVALMYGLVKGLTNQGADLSRLSYFRRMGVGVIHYAEYETVILMAWSVKPLLGTISDLVPIFGYKKKYYTAAYGLMGFGALIGCTLLPQKESYGSLAAAFYFLGALGVCGTDILCEGKFSELMARFPETGASIVTWAWWWYTAGGIIAAAIAGTVAQHADPNIILWTVAPLFLSVVIPALLGWIPERRRKSCCGCGGSGDANESFVSNSSSNEDHRHGPTSISAGRKPPASNGSRAAEYEEELLHDEHDSWWDAHRQQQPKSDEREDDVATVAAPSSPLPRDLDLATGSSPILDINESFTPPSLASYRTPTLVLGAINGIAALIVAGMTLFTHEKSNLWRAFGVNLGFGVLLLIGAKIFLPHMVFCVAAFAFIKEILYLHSFPIVDFYATSSASCIADAPHFDYEYYQFYLNLVGNTASAFGIILFDRVLSKNKFFSTVVLTTTVKSLASIFTIIVVKRWNIAAGVSDKVTFMFGVGVAFHICSILDFMVFLVLLSKACPKGVETTSYAVIVGFLSFGQTVSRSLAYLMAETMHITTHQPSLANATAAPPSLAENITNTLVPMATTITDTCNFDNLPLLLFIGHFVMPLLIYPLGYWLLPDVRMNEPLSVHKRR